MKLVTFTYKTAGFVLTVLALSFILLPARAATIGYVANDLVDVTPGEDLWRYDYKVSGHSFLQSEFFDIYFIPSLSEDLTSGPAPNADWDVMILQQPNPVNFPPFDDGIFDAFALLANPSLSGTFSVTFIYLGAGSPGAQRFDIFDASSNLLETGLTSVQPPTVIPEPSTVVLSLVGLIGSVIQFHRRTKIRRSII